MTKSFSLKFGAALLITGLLAGGAMAQDATAATSTTVPGHPRVSEVDQRLQNQQNRVDQGVANGTITAKQAARDTKRDTVVAQKLSADQAKNGGHITKREQRRLNKKLNKDSAAIAKQKAE